MHRHGGGRSSGLACCWHHRDSGGMTDSVARSAAEELSLKPAAAEAFEARVRRNLGRVMFLARWIMAPLYLGLLGSLVLIVVKFVQTFVGSLPGLLPKSTTETLLDVLSLVDLALVGNLVV